MKQLTGRIVGSPSTLLHEEVLKPQFLYELKHLLPYYVQIEMAQLEQYERLGVLDRRTSATIAELLDALSPDALIANPDVNMSDIAFAIECYVAQALSAPAVGWHVDRSRNDLQACAQAMLIRDQTLNIARSITAFGWVAYHLAEKTLTQPMPGYTHYQAAQIISPGFYLTAIVAATLSSLDRLASFYTQMNRCPLGAGAMAGQELAWDRDSMAARLGFDGAVKHALVAVASREIPLCLATELAIFSVALGRFATDFIHWSSSEYRFIDLSDELAGISSAMPQKKNFPILERIRGKAAHMSGFLVDMLFVQRGTSYTNLVEVSKESTVHVLAMMRTMHTVLSLFTAVLEHMSFNEERLQRASEQNWSGCFSLANALTLQGGIPVRTAHVIVGKFVAESARLNLPSPVLGVCILKELCYSYGYTLELTEDSLREIFDPLRNLYRKVSPGSTNPQKVQELLVLQAGELQQHSIHWEERCAQLQGAAQALRSHVRGHACE